MLNDHGAGHASTGVSHQVLEQGEFLGGQFDVATTASDPSLHPIQSEVFDGKHRLRGQTVSPQEDANTGGEFGKRERLDQIVVRPCIKAENTVFYPAARGQHKDGQIRLASPHLPQNGYTIQVRKGEIENHKIKVNFCSQSPRLLPVKGDVHGIVLRFQSLAYETGECRIVFSDENAHNRPRSADHSLCLSSL